ncbi:MAG: hypothetical protein JNM65_17950 [Verrucomicrobiaceae bacterium]|nr:hypothetical protein [Verrucomicrobiaceae bacterium]
MAANFVEHQVAFARLPVGIDDKASGVVTAPSREFLVIICDWFNGHDPSEAWFAGIAIESAQTSIEANFSARTAVRACLFAGTGKYQAECPNEHATS